MKRIFDVILALALAILLLPVFVAIVIAMKILSPGPVLFRQERLSKNGSTFLMNKFRKFPAGWGNQGPGVTLQFDSRMTGIGRVLERTKLDELPQLWNVFIGEMSFVGPRPESLRFRHLFTGEFARVLEFTPGIFGPNQTKYRNESAMYPPNEDPTHFYEQVLFPDKARADIAYFSRANILSDIYCIASGIFVLAFNVIVWRRSMRSSLVLLSWDICAVAVGWVVTHWLKYSLVARVTVKAEVVTLFKSGFVVAPLATLIVFTMARVYRHPIRYFSETDFYRMVGASCAAWILSAVTFSMLSNPTSALLISVACVVSIFLMAMPRFAYQQWHSLTDQVRNRTADNEKVNLVVCGINEQSIELCNLLKGGFHRAKVIGMITEDELQVRREIHGFEVIGLPADLDMVKTRYGVEQVWIGESLSVETRRFIEAWCVRNNVEKVALHDLPGFRTLASQSDRLSPPAPAVYSKKSTKPVVQIKGNSGSRKNPEVVV